MTIKELILYGTKKLKENNIESANLQAKILIIYLLKTQKEYLIINEDKELNKEIEEKYKKNINKIIDGLPIQYITKNQEFMKLNFYVDKNVLIPQPDTEILVEETINLSKNIENVKILDICTGSGAIAISLAKYINNAKIIATDISEKAIKIAKKNAKENKVEEKIQFIISDMFNEIQNQEFDIIVSNPPYIEKNVIETLSKQVKNEPYIALNGGEDGLDFYKILSNNAYKFLKKDGYLCLEIGYNQKKDVEQLLKKENKYKDRIIIAKKKV